MSILYETHCLEKKVLMCDTIVNTYRAYNINNNIDENILSNKVSDLWETFYDKMKKG